MLRQGADVGSGRLVPDQLEETGVWSIKGPGRMPTWWATFPEQREGEYRPSSSFAETKLNKNSTPLTNDLVVMPRLP